MSHTDRFLALIEKAAAEMKKYQDRTKMFSLIKFNPHHIPGAIRGLYKFENNYSISVVSGCDGSGLYGRIQDETYEVLIIYPSDETGEVIGWQTKDEVSAIMWAISQVK